MPPIPTPPPVLSWLSGDFAAALALLTRLPVWAHAPRGAAAAWAWPLAGAAVGLIGAAAAGLALALGAAAGPAAAAALAAAALATGALHEDGLADTADGLMGGRDRTARLAIMKDSRIGAFGALALVVVTLARWSALATLLGQGVWTAAAALVAAEAQSRAAMAGVMAALPLARAGGLAALTGRPSLPVAAAASGIALVLALALVGWPALPMAIAAALAAALVGRAAQARIGGQTGDILGAAQQVAAAAALALA